MPTEEAAGESRRFRPLVRQRFFVRQRGVNPRDIDAKTIDQPLSVQLEIRAASPPSSQRRGNMLVPAPIDVDRVVQRDQGLPQMPRFERTAKAHNRARKGRAADVMRTDQNSLANGRVSPDSRLLIELRAA